MTNKGKVIKKALQGVAKVFNKNYDKLEIAPFSLEQVLKADDDHSLALAALSEVMRIDGDTKDAVKYMEKAVDAAPRNIDYRLRLADLYEGQQKLDLALTALKRAQSLVKDKRTPASKAVSDLNERIRLLESQVNKKAPGEKVSLDKEERVKQ